MTLSAPREIDGSKVVHGFTILHEGWETDNQGWVTADGRLWTTWHGGPPIVMRAAELDLHAAKTRAWHGGPPIVMRDAELDLHAAKTRACLDGLLKARRVVNRLRQTR